MGKKKIRFIDSRYNTLFEVEDGEEVELIFKDDIRTVRTVRKCRYIDETHFYFGDNCYHIRQFAEIMEGNGTKYQKHVDSVK